MFRTVIWRAGVCSAVCVSLCVCELHAEMDWCSMRCVHVSVFVILQSTGSCSLSEVALLERVIHQQYSQYICDDFADRLSNIR